MFHKYNLFQNCIIFINFSLLASEKLMFFLTFFIPIGNRIDIVADFADQDINIAYSHNENIIIGHKHNLFDEKAFTLANLNHLEDQNINVISRISKNKTKYSIKVGSDFICIKKNELLKCDEFIDFFTISYKKFGFRIKKNNRCLTYDNGLSMKKCGLPDQTFIFKKLGIKQQCKLKESEFVNKRRNKGNRNKHQNINVFYSDTGTSEKVKKMREKQMEDVLKKHIPNIEKKPKVKDILEKIYKAENGWSWPNISKWSLLAFFCP